MERATAKITSDPRISLFMSCRLGNRRTFCEQGGKKRTCGLRDMGNYGVFNDLIYIILVVWVSIKNVGIHD